jgi:membrane protein YqaA with SNARE-associated domain
MKSLYHWVLSWAESPYGTRFMAFISFAESSFFPIPADPLLIALALGKIRKALYFALVCTVASVLGGVFGYIIGYFLWWSSPNEFSSIANFFFNNVPGFSIEVFRNVQQQYENYNFLVIFLAAFTPIPYKVFSISAGAFFVNLPIFVIASTLGRGLRYFALAFLIKIFGKPIKELLDKYFNLFIILLTILFIFSYFLVVYFFN